MLTPEYLQSVPEAMVELYAQAEADILTDMARRINGFDLFIPSAQYQLQRLEEMGAVRSGIVKRLSALTGKSRKELAAIMGEAGAEALKADEAVYRAAGLRASPLNASPAVQEVLKAGLKKTQGLFTNLTKTTANTATKQFERALDRAYMQIGSGAIDAETAIRGAIKDLAKQGVEAVRYPGSHTDTLEVAVRRATITGVNQTCLQMQLARADELGVDLVETTAHAGARPSHAEWQGQIFSRSGKSLKYPDFVSATGYGTGEGLGGWNCSHSFRPYVEGMPRTYSKELLEEYEAKSYEYNGQKMTEYEAMQTQRQIERHIRRWKRENMAMAAAEKDTTESAARLRRWQEEQKNFIRQTGLKRQTGREQVAGWGKSQAATARAGAERYYQKWSKGIGANDQIKTLAKYYGVKYTNSPRYNLLKGYARAVEKGDISPLVGFERYEEVNVELQKWVVGVTAANGVRIESFATHFVDRVIGQTSTPHKRMRQGVEIEDVLDALQNPIEISKPRTLEDGDIRQTLTGKKASIAVSIRDKLLIQTNPRG